MTIPLADGNARLRGMLHKRHQNSRFSSWGKRYFEVDDDRGLLYYFRTRAAQQWDEPARHFMLSSLLDCHPVPLPSGHSFGIELTLSSGAGCTQRMVLRAESEAEYTRWLVGLRRRISSLAAQGEQGIKISSRPPTPRAWETDSKSSRSALGVSPAPARTRTAFTPVSPVDFRQGASEHAWDAPNKEHPQAKACDGAAGAIASATLAATRAAARAEAALLANEMCQAMSATSDISPRGKYDADIERFLEQRQREVWAQLAEDEEHQGGYPDQAAQDMLAALGATPGMIQGIGGGGGRFRRGSLELDVEAMRRALGTDPDCAPDIQTKMDELGSTSCAQFSGDDDKVRQVTPVACRVPLAFGLDVELDVCGM
ncbi:hypothetical protein AB1Y20_018121 [Prymnesium parvum]|uniref:PH domain-containing protein n=1 Tax=Prymnesium parvum TaxID=97485 RepID=A0AB34JNQ9_PRYPA